MYHFAAVDAAGRVRGLVELAADAAPWSPVALVPPVTELPPRVDPAHSLQVTGGVLSWADLRDSVQRRADARTRRDVLLAACDWLVTRAMETGQPVPLEWAAYRQLLREIPQQPGFPDAIDWPTPPTEP